MVTIRAYKQLKSEEQPCLFHFHTLWSQRDPSKIATPAVFQAVVRDIGKSFQLAITTSRLNLIDYGNATAQS